MPLRSARPPRLWPPACPLCLRGRLDRLCDTCRPRVAVLLEEERRVAVPGCDVVFASIPYEPPARDLLVLAKAVMAHAEIRRRVATRKFRATIVTASGSRRTESWKNTNRLLGIEGYRGVKTGTTSKAGACLVSNAVRGENSLFIVVLNSNDRQGRYVDTRNLFRWAFSQRLAGGK